MSQNTTTEDEEQPERELRFDVTAERFREFMDPIHALVNEAKLEFDHDGIRVAAVDPANVAMVEAELYPTAFKRFGVSEGEIGLNIREIGRFLELVPDDTVVRFELVDFKKFTLRAGRFEWKQAWIDPDAIRRTADLPDLDLPAEIILPGEELARAVDYARFVKRGGHSRLVVDPSRREFVVSIQGDTDDGEYCLHEEDGLRIRRDGYAESRYSNDYLKDCVDGIPEGADVRMELGEEYPFSMKYGIDEGQIEVMQAPRIQSD